VDALVPGMPPAARSRITSQAQGIPLFAVETVRALIDRDIVQPVEGVYRLVGDVGELAVPDSLHALLAARLDALDPGVRRLVTDAAVLGTTFPAEALTAVSGRDGPDVRAALAELVRREVFSVSADPLSPERGSYQFAQQMLRQVAYDTLSRRDRKTRHLQVAAHLRATFAGDGEEVADVIAQHYLDALNAVPDDPDIPEIRGHAIGALIRAAERAERTGAPARAASSYAAAAQLTPPADADGQLAAPDAGLLWERAAQAAVLSADYGPAVQHAGRAREYHLRLGQDRAAARAQAISGKALRQQGRLAEAREQLTAAVAVLRAEPDTDTVGALDELAALEAFAGSPDADRLSTEALILGQALGVGASQLSGLLQTRAIHLAFAARPTEAAAYLREAAQLATQANDNYLLGIAALNLGAVLTDPASAVEAARTAAGHFRRVGNPDCVGIAIGNLAAGLMNLGDWDAAEEELTQAIASGELAEHGDIARLRAELAALRGDADAAETMFEGLRDRSASEEVQHQASVSYLQAIIAAARGQLEDALRHARRALVHVDAIGMAWLAETWALAARTAFDVRDIAAARELLALLDSQPSGHTDPLLRTERDLARARLAGHDGDPAAGAAFAAAISSLRELGRPYYLAHGLLDQARFLMCQDDAEAAGVAIAEARDIGQRLRCPPLLDRADTIEHAKPRILA
jgi:tetratricopeptide (TPR) repeat protein